ncbi:MAG: hypothetical protein E6J90_24515 [Deltaproteobacteria bacterium]|nr:MAG: hypothetical protein E6J90_24515 [Deltaproteobacteria bacterium]
MTNVAEPRALSAALAAPAFVTRTTGAAMHAADRHVERWAPEANAGRVRSMRSLGFVDRLVAPWIETAQRSASMRLFHQYAQSGLGERSTSSVSWVFPRPWYQDELDWMAAARRTGAQTAVERQPAPTLLTTRGTYVAPVQAASAVAAPPLVMPAALYEHVAPSLSIAASQRAAIAGVGFGGDARSRGEVYSPLVPLAAVQAAELMTRMVAPLASARGAAAGAAMTPALRTVLTSILARAAVHAGAPATRISTLAPELVTPPSPRPEAQAAREAPAAGEPGALQVAESYAAQRTRVAELERIALSSAQRELAARAAATPVAPAAGAPASAEAGARVAAEAARAATQAAELRAAAERAEIELRQRTAAGQAETQRRADTARTEAQRQAEAARTEAQRQADAATAAVRAAEAQRQAEAGTAAVRAAEAQRQADAARTEAQRHADAATAAVRAAEAQRQADAATAAVRAAEAQRRAEAAGTAVRATEAQRQADAASAAGAERAQIEARIAQRIAERTSAQRLHEQARAEAAAHARAGELRPIAGLPAPASSTLSPAEGGPASARLPASISAPSARCRRSMT